MSNVGRGRAALHEAGHAVVARLMGLEVREILVADGHGRTRYRARVEGESVPIEVYVAYAVATLAGEAAERTFGFPGPASETVDRVLARALIEDLAEHFGRDPGELQGQLAADVAALCHRERTAIESLAARLEVN